MDDVVATSPEGLREQALRRIKKRRDLHTHAFAYLTINVLLWGVWVIIGATSHTGFRGRCGSPSAGASVSPSTPGTCTSGIRSASPTSSARWTASSNGAERASHSPPWPTTSSPHCASVLLGRHRARGAARDAHLVGLPHGRAGLQAQEADPPAVPGLHDAGAPARDVRRGGGAEPAPRAGPLPGRAGRDRARRGAGARGARRHRRARLPGRDAALRRGADPRRARRGRAAAAGRRGGGSARGLPRVGEPVRDGDPVAALAATLEGTVATLGSLLGPGDADALAALAAFSRAWLAGRGDVLRERAGRGLVRDGHGDLRAEHVVCEPEIAVVDCVEFDPRCGRSTWASTSRISRWTSRGAGRRPRRTSWCARTATPAAIPATRSCSPSSLPTARS